MKDFEVVTVALGISFVITLHTVCISVVRSLYFKII